MNEWNRKQLHEWTNIKIIAFSFETRPPMNNPNPNNDCNIIYRKIFFKQIKNVPTHCYSLQNLRSINLTTVELDLGICSEFSRSDALLVLDIFANEESETFIWLSCMLCISTSKWVFCTPFAGWNHLFLCENKLFRLFSSLTEKRKRKK